MQSWPGLFSSFSKHPLVGSAPPVNLSFALVTQPPKFGSVGLKGVSAFCWHLSSEPAFFAMHLFLLTRHLLCGPAHAPPLSRHSVARMDRNVAVRLWTMIAPLKCWSVRDMHYTIRDTL